MNSTSPRLKQTHPPELNALVADFHAWRAQRPSRRTPIPDALRSKAVALLDSCRRTHIIKALGINNTMLKSWQNPDVAASSPTAFVPMSLLADSEPDNASPMAVTLINPLGQQVTLAGDFSAAQLALMVRALSDRTQGEEQAR